MMVLPSLVNGSPWKNPWAGIGNISKEESKEQAETAVTSVTGLLAGYVVGKHQEAQELSKETDALKDKREVLLEKKSGLERELSKEHLIQPTNGLFMDMLMGAGGGAAILGPGLYNTLHDWRALGIALAGGALFGFLFNISFRIARE
ncbi:MAG: hypothetical protein HYU64_00105 [Armatimonadetes bacterium]|nr:hypothetical protein [Armatimonadota bacterium]